MPGAPPRPRKPLLFLDYDGTLAPIVDDPDAARPHPDVPNLLTELQTRFPLWVITGRDVAALQRLLPVEVQVVGLHGSERGTLGGEVVNVARESHGEDFERMRASVPKIRGVRIEEKSGAFAVHYRHADDPATAVKALREWAATTPGSLESVWGKKVVELRPVGISKGTAVLEIAGRHPDHTPIYLGDDVTDEDAFLALADHDPNAVTIKIGEGETAARHRLPDVEAVVEYLKGLIE